MTIRGRIVSLFPLVYLILIIFFLGKSLIGFLWWQIPVLLSLIYLLPLLLFRIHSFFSPVQEGTFDLSKKTYSPWWTSHMLQYPFIALPWLESLLHFVPGLYSVWLRAWGSKVGKKIFWTPRTEIIDRSLVEIGDSTLIGHMTIMVSHVVDTREGVPKLIVHKVRIGSNCLVGADAQLGPGTLIENGTKLKPKARFFWKGEWK
ncbi:MAG: acyl transferase [Bdellovibrionota bacterium]